MPAIVGLDPVGMRRLSRELTDAGAKLRSTHGRIDQVCRSAGIADPTAGRLVRAALHCEQASADVRRRTVIVEWRLDAWSRSGLHVLLRLSAGFAGPVDDVVTGARRLRTWARTGDLQAAMDVPDSFEALARRLDGAAAAAARRGAGAIGDLAVPLGQAARATRIAGDALPWVGTIGDIEELIDPTHDGWYGVADRVVAGASLGATGVSMAAAAGLITLTPVGATVIGVVVVGGAVYTLGSMAWDEWGDEVTASVRTSWRQLEAGSKAALELAVDGANTVVRTGKAIRDGLVTRVELGVEWSGDRVDELAELAGDAADALTFWD